MFDQSSCINSRKKKTLGDIIEILTHEEMILPLDKSNKEFTLNNWEQFSLKKTCQEMNTNMNQSSVKLSLLPMYAFTKNEYWNVGVKIVECLGELRRYHLDKLVNLTSHFLQEFSEDVNRFNSALNEDGQYILSREEGENIILTGEQTSSLAALLCYPTLSIVGMPGNGKSLVIEALSDFYGSDKISVVTHGGCMANELQRRGIDQARNIHQILKMRFNGYLYQSNNFTEETMSQNEQVVDFDKIKILVIDEFSNVSDELAASIYSIDVFPNLKCIIHVFDPIQTQPIDSGALKFLRSIFNRPNFNKNPKSSFVNQELRLGFFDLTKSKSFIKSNRMKHNNHTCLSSSYRNTKDCHVMLLYFLNGPTNNTFLVWI